MLFVALLIMSILNPFVGRLAKLKIPRAVSILLAYVVVFIVIGFAIASIIPPLIEQTSILVEPIPDAVASIATQNEFAEKMLSEVLSLIGALPGQLTKAIGSILSNVVGIITVFVIAFYLLLARNRLDEQLGVFFGPKNKKKFTETIDILEGKLGGWARGQIALMVIVGVATYIGLTVLGIPFALPLAILAGLLEIIPYIGPVLAGIPAVIIALGISPLMGVATAAMYFIVQQLENYVFVPKVMERSVGVSPIITLLALAIGFKLAGMAGVILAVPIVITLQVVGSEYLSSE